VGKKSEPATYFFHREGVKNVKKICDFCIKNEIKYLSLYAFSTENWKRPHDEISGLMNIFRDFLLKDARDLIKKDIKLLISGRYWDFPADIVSSIEKLQQESYENTSLYLNIMLNYGGRTEILDAVKKIIKEKITEDKIDEKSFSSFLYNSIIPDPDIFIRTGKEKRISNFLLYQLAYTELFFTESMWPDFSEKEFEAIIDEYNNRERRFGAL